MTSSLKHVPIHAVLVVWSHLMWIQILCRVGGSYATPYRICGITTQHNVLVYLRKRRYIKMHNKTAKILLRYANYSESSTFRRMNCCFCRYSSIPSTKTSFPWCMRQQREMPGFQVGLDVACEPLQSAYRCRCVRIVDKHRCIVHVQRASFVMILSSLRTSWIISCIWPSQQVHTRSDSGSQYSTRSIGRCVKNFSRSPDRFLRSWAVTVCVSWVAFSEESFFHSTSLNKRRYMDSAS